SHDRRDGLDAHLAGNGRMVIDIELDELHAALGLVDDTLQDRRKLLARATPRSPEIDENRLVARIVDDVGCERGRARILDIAAAGIRAIRCSRAAQLCGASHLATIGAAVGIVCAAHVLSPGSRLYRVICRETS